MEICCVPNGHNPTITRRTIGAQPRSTCPSCNTCTDPCGRACALYTGPQTTTWPCQSFPADQYARRYSSSALREARAAWATFERVEAHDAAVRVALSGTGRTCKSLWYRFRSNEEYIAYQRGQQLHCELCNGFSWRPQRSYGISATPVADVSPPCFS
jgi:hypothetical protein